MIVGIGTDIIEIERVQRAIERTPHFLNKVFTPKENDYFKEIGHRGESIAGNFAAKEAISKAFGTGFRTFGPQDIEILRDVYGKPIVQLYNEAQSIKEILKVSTIHLSISHCKTYATAFATLEGRDKDEVSNKGTNEKNR